MANAAPPYANCTEAHNDGRWDIPVGDEAYWDDELSIAPVVAALPGFGHLPLHRGASTVLSFWPP